MGELQGGSGVLTMTIQITRKATGKVEEYHLVGGATPEQAQEIANSLKHPTEEPEARKES